MRLIAMMLCVLMATPAFAVKGFGRNNSKGLRETRREQTPQGKQALDTAARELNEAIGKVNAAGQSGQIIPEIRMPRNLENPTKENEIAQKAEGLRKTLEKVGEKNLAEPEMARQFKDLVESANAALDSRPHYAQVATLKGFDRVEGADKVLGVIDNIFNHLRAKVAEPAKTNEVEMIEIYATIGKVTSAEAAKEQVRNVITKLAELGKTANEVITCR